MYVAYVSVYGGVVLRPMSCLLNGVWVCMNMNLDILLWEYVLTYCLSLVIIKNMVVHIWICYYWTCVFVCPLTTEISSYNVIVLSSTCLYNMYLVSCVSDCLYFKCQINQIISKWKCTCSMKTNLCAGLCSRCADQSAMFITYKQHTGWDTCDHEGKSVKCKTADHMKDRL